jgi:hypothetical protein
MIDGKLSCDTWAEAISFSPDRSTATFHATRKYIVAGDKRTNTITYRVLGVRDNAITMAMNEEHRKTEKAAPRLRCKGEKV